MDIGLENIEYAIVKIADHRLVWAALEKIGKTVIVTNEEDKWKNLIKDTGYNLSDFNIVFSDADPSKIRGYRAYNVFILSDCNLKYDQIEEIISGFILVSSDPIKPVKEREVNKIKKSFGLKENAIENEQFQLIWNKK